MFDGIQEGIIVMKGEKLHFMNELSKKLIEIVPKINKDNKEIQGIAGKDFNKIRDMLFDAKIFWAFDHNMNSSTNTKSSTKLKFDSCSREMGL